jgi:hypothetical protein
VGQFVDVTTNEFASTAERFNGGGAAPHKGVQNNITFLRKVANRLACKFSAKSCWVSVKAVR